MGFILDGLKSVFKTLTKLSRPTFTLGENELIFKIDSDVFYKHQISNIETKTRHDPYILDAYTLTSNKLYIEYIHTDNDVIWNGSALSSFINLLKYEIKAKSMDILETKEFKHYEFLTYKIDNSYILNIIYIYEVNKEIFIVDKSSELYTNLLKYFHRGYIYKFEKNENLNLDLNLSLVRNNAIYSYFKTGSEGN